VKQVTIVRILMMSLLSPLDKIEKLQNALHVKAKTEANFRFYSLWDKISRRDILDRAYERCAFNGGVPGKDQESFDRIENQGVERWLAKLEEELKTKQYCPRPLLRVWIPKSNGGKRPLGIACIRDRVVMLAANMILEPIFEADLHPNQYGFRRELDAKMALRRVFYNIGLRWR